MGERKRIAVKILDDMGIESLRTVDVTETMSQTIDHLIINGPYDKPKKYWLYDSETRLFKLVDGRRPAGYLEASEKKGSISL